MHCTGMMPQATKQGDCHLMSDAGSSGTGGSTYGTTMEITKKATTTIARTT
jgi:hypothetical protein